MRHHTHTTTIDARPAWRARSLIVAVLALAMFIAMGFVPADATSGGDDLEAVRSTVIETYNYKIGLLQNKKAETSNPDRQAAYQSGIDQLSGLLDTTVATSTDIEELWGLKDTAHDIYHAAVAAADDVEPTPEEALAEAKERTRSKVARKIKALEQWIEGCDDPRARSIVAEGIAELESLYPLIDAAETPDEAYAIKARVHDIYNETIARAENAKGDDDDDDDDDGKDDDEKDDEEDKAAKELAQARNSTLTLIERRAAVLKSAAAAARIPAVIEIYSAAAEEVASWKTAAKKARSIGELRTIQENVLAVYEEATAEADAVRDDVDTSPEETVASYLEHVVNYVTGTTQAAAATADDSPETFEDLVAAKRLVIDRVDDVREVAESGNRLDARWDALEDAMSDYRRALLRHYIALGEPMVIAGVQVPG